jgi:hypothetical protein
MTFLKKFEKKKEKDYTQCIKNLPKKRVFMRVSHNEACKKYILNF